MPPFLQELLDRIGGPRRAAIYAVGVATMVAILLVSRWATEPQFVPAFAGVPLESVGKMTAALEQAGVSYKLERGGTEIAVSEEDVARARVILAGAGLPAQGRPGLELFDQQSWGMTDFTQKINYRRALEGELERTIGTMKGIERAQVHLAIRETQAFRRAGDTPAEASVVVKLRGGQRPEADVVRGIAQLVASSVDNLEAERVAVIDDAGRLLSRVTTPNDPASLSSAQLEQQRAVEDHLTGKAATIVEQMVGAGNAQVSVAADLSFDQVERMSQVVDPEKQALSTEQRAEIVPGTDGGAGSTNIATSFDNSRTVETVKSATGTVKRLTVSVLVKDRVDAKGKPVSRPQAELDQLAALVRTAVGVDSARGDQVTVVSAPFETVTALAPESTGEKVLRTVQTVQRPALGLLALVAVALVALMALRTLRPAAAQTAAGPDGAMLAAGSVAPDGTFLPAGTLNADGTPALPASLQAAAAQDELPPAPPATPFRPAGNPLRDKVVATADAYPDVAVKVLRTWIRNA
ncbi:MAG: flagellar M-ring protein FliF [Gemmatimonadaceae bacterium]|nr:flagellar M-ring protein FliF [Gemmatimonadaceae bacterium]